ncbi:MAG: radical SAM protein [Deltaproteobacteria bacterium]|nr:radical SAM protein [Deltaproteobacteria bacterium]
MTVRRDRQKGVAMGSPEIARRIDSLKRILRRCVLCPRMCRVDREAGDQGFCRLGAGMVMSSALPHHGEEPPLSGSRGAGTIFFSSCNLKCIYCQNYQISHSPAGRPVTAEEMAGIMLELAAEGCHNIEPVTPTPHLAGIMEALGIARQRGLSVPFVFNCGGYERVEILRLIDGAVEIYLPDFKYGLDEAGMSCSGVPDYPRRAQDALREMVRQVGAALEVADGVARRGLLVRHLVLPGRIDNSLAALDLIREVSPSIPLSLMSQYTPIPAVQHDPLFGRRVTRAEYERVVDAALDLGFEEIYTQEVDDRALNPDFERDKPFDWE